MHGSILIAISVIVLLVCCIYLYQRYQPTPMMEGFWGMKKKKKKSNTPQTIVSEDTVKNAVFALGSGSTLGKQLSGGIPKFIAEVKEQSRKNAEAAAKAAAAEAEKRKKQEQENQARIANENARKQAEAERTRIKNRSVYYGRNEKSQVKLLAKLGVNLDNKKTDGTIKATYATLLNTFKGWKTKKNQEEIDSEIIDFIAKWGTTIQPIGNITQLQVALNDIEHIFGKARVSDEIRDTVDLFIDAMAGFKYEFDPNAKGRHRIINDIVGIMKTMDVNTQDELKDMLTLIKKLKFQNFSRKSSVVSFTQFVTDLVNRGFRMKGSVALSNMDVIQRFGYTSRNHGEFMGVLSKIGLSKKTPSAEVLTALANMGVRYDTYTDFLKKTFQNKNGYFSTGARLINACTELKQFGVYYNNEETNFFPENYDNFMRSVIMPIVTHLKTSKADTAKLMCYAIKDDLVADLNTFNAKIELSDCAIRVILANLTAIGISSLDAYEVIFTTLDEKYYKPTIQPYLFNMNVRRFFGINEGDENKSEIYGGYMSRVVSFANSFDYASAGFSNSKPKDTDVYINYIKNNNLNYAEVYKLDPIEDMNKLRAAVHSYKIQRAHKETRNTRKDGFTGMVSGWGQMISNLFKYNPLEGFGNSSELRPVTQLKPTDKNVTVLLRNFGITDANNITIDDKTMSVTDFLNDVSATGATELKSLATYLYTLMNIRVNITNYYPYTDLLSGFQVPVTEYLTITALFNKLKLTYYDISTFLQCLTDLGVNYYTLPHFLDVLLDFGVKFDREYASGSRMRNKHMGFNFLRFMKLVNLMYRPPDEAVFDPENNPFMNAIRKMRQLVEYMEPERKTVMINEFFGVGDRHIKGSLATIIIHCYVIDTWLGDFRRYNPHNPRKHPDAQTGETRLTFELMSQYKFIPQTMVNNEQFRLIANAWNNSTNKYPHPGSAAKDYYHFLDKVKVSLNSTEGTLGDTLPTEETPAEGSPTYVWPVSVDLLQACMTTAIFDEATKNKKADVELLLTKLKRNKVRIDGALQQGVLETMIESIMSQAEQDNSSAFEANAFSANLCILFPYTTAKYVTIDLFANTEHAKNRRNYYINTLRCERSMIAPMSKTDKKRCQLSGHSTGNTTNGFTGHMLSSINDAFQPVNTQMLPVQRDTTTPATPAFGTYSGRPQYEPYRI
jgi:hypothetical protein